MILRSRQELKDCLKWDAKANWRKRTRASFWGDEKWKFLISMRKKEYYRSFSAYKKLLFAIPILLNKLRFHVMSVKCGYTIPDGICGKGLALPHRGTIVINTTAKIGENCRIHEGVTIGATSGSTKSAIIGNNVFIGSGAKIIGDLTIADDVAIGANSVVVKSIIEQGTTWAGVPAKLISHHDSHSNLSPELFIS